MYLKIWFFPLYRLIHRKDTNVPMNILMSNFCRMDLRFGDPWPTRKLVQALGKSLDTLPGEDPNQYVALWYQQGEPIMGRIWNKDGKVCAFWETEVTAMVAEI